MTKHLSHAEITSYHETGYCTPVAVMPAELAGAYRARLDRVVAEYEPEVRAVLKMKSHLAIACLDELVRLPAILDAVEDLLGPDILVWSSSIFDKPPEDSSYVSWHQDLTYWGLDPPRLVSAWLALSESSCENGCMRFIPSSHRGEIVAHRDTHAEHNLLSRGQVIDVDFDEARAVDVALQPGEMSLHHVKLFHASAPNRSKQRRLGYVIRYISPDVRQVRGTADSATLVRGRDRYGHFEAEPRPRREFDRDTLARHREICGQSARFLYDDAG